MILKELKKGSTLVFLCFARDAGLAQNFKVAQNVNCDLPKARNMAETDNFELLKFSKITQIICPELLIMTSNFTFTLFPRLRVPHI